MTSKLHACARVARSASIFRVREPLEDVRPARLDLAVSGLAQALHALAELQAALPGELASERPLRLVLDRRPFI